MSRLPEIIVLLWFVPVMLQIVLPLTILIGMSIIRLLRRGKSENLKNSQGESEKDFDAQHA